MNASYQNVISSCSMRTDKRVSHCKTNFTYKCSLYSISVKKYIYVICIVLSLCIHMFYNVCYKN